MVGVLLSGTFLTFFFQPSMTEVVYDGVYAPLKGAHMSIAYASSLDITFEVRGGLLMRQVHHWSALLFVAAAGLHMLRVFFTGPEDLPEANIEDGEAEVGFYAPWSWWPFALGIGSAICFTSLAVGWWLFAIGFPLALIALIGFVFEHSRGQHAH